MAFFLAMFPTRFDRERCRRHGLATLHFTVGVPSSVPSTLLICEEREPSHSDTHVWWLTTGLLVHTERAGHFSVAGPSLILPAYMSISTALLSRSLEEGAWSEWLGNTKRGRGWFSNAAQLRAHMLRYSDIRQTGIASSLWHVWRLAERRQGPGMLGAAPSNLDSTFIKERACSSAHVNQRERTLAYDAIVVTGCASCHKAAARH
jgi:hypothetical protein